MKHILLSAVLFAALAIGLNAGDGKKATADAKPACCAAAQKADAKSDSAAAKTDGAKSGCCAVAKTADAKSSCPMMAKQAKDGQVKGQEAKSAGCPGCMMSGKKVVSKQPVTSPKAAVQAKN